MRALLGVDGWDETYDLAGAYVQAQVGVRVAKNAGPPAAGDELLEVLAEAVNTPRRLWALLYGALQFRATAQVLRLCNDTRAAKVALDAVAGTEAPRLLSLAVQTSAQAAKLIYARLERPETRQSWLAWTDGSGDSVLHRVCRSSPSLLSKWSKDVGLDPTLLTKLRNVVGHAPLDEAVRAQTGEALHFLWRQRRAWGLEDAILQACLLGARDGEVAGLLALLAGVPGEDLSLRSLGTAAVAAASANDQFAVVGDLSRSMAPPSPPSPTRAQIRPLATELEGTRYERPQSDGLQVHASSTAVPPPPASGHASSQLVAWLGRGAKGVEIALRDVEAAANDASSPGEAEAHNATAWRLIDALERWRPGVYFGRHFLAHRPTMTDEQLQRRLVSFRRYGASRFGQKAAVAILRLRRRALAAAVEARREVQLPPGRYALQLYDADAQGFGFVDGGPNNVALRFEGSEEVRAVVALVEAEPPRLISLYPTAPRARRGAARTVLVPLSDG